MKSIHELSFGKRDAVAYKTPKEKSLFESIFVADKHLDELCSSSNYFLTGDKGTGKTAYAKFISEVGYCGFTGNLVSMEDTDYRRFIELKNKKNLSSSDYSNIWNVVLLLLVANELATKEGENIFKHLKFKKLHDAIDEFYFSSFKPEIHNALELVESSADAASQMYSNISASENSRTPMFKDDMTKRNMMYIIKQFEDAIKSTSLEKKHILFIDGIDVRPDFISYEEYLECVKGLSNSIWYLNTKIFSDLLADNVNIKVVLLIRPDILDSVRLQNLNNKMNDNVVLLDWRTSYNEYENSVIYELADRILSSQQSKNYNIGECWEHYFPFSSQYNRNKDKSFVEFLRYSFSRPRDIIAMMECMKSIRTRNGDSNNCSSFSLEDFKRATPDFSNYLLGEIKDYLSFYYKEDDFDTFRKFFDYLSEQQHGRGTDFTPEQFNEAFDRFSDYLAKNIMEKPVIFNTADTLLQFLYELNIICYEDGKLRSGNTKYCWCYKERNYANMRPKVKFSYEYRVHYGIGRALGLIKNNF
ncbi:hypothetical protein AB8I88_004343 [Vibrio fluvialis]|nr:MULTISPECIES: hypothetical protein [Vibrio]